MPKNLTPAEKVVARQTTHCHICEKPFISLNTIRDVVKRDNARKVEDHCHITGKFRGMAHNECNKNFFLARTIPVFFHNFSKYDSHLIIRELMEIEPDYPCTVIPHNTETYVAVNKTIKVQRDNQQSGQQNTFLTLSFRDTFRFLGTSLEKLALNLEADDFKILRSELIKDYGVAGIDSKLDLLRRKGVFPYELVEKVENFERYTELPDKKSFESCLNGYKGISDEDYQHAANVWNAFNCKDLGEYSDLYLKTDVLILADVWERFRNNCTQAYDLDPANFYTTPGLSWDALLKSTNVELELLTDHDQITFIKSGIRGGLSQCSLRKISANNKYINGEADDEDSTYLVYLDVNNLYGYAASQKLPLNDFHWVEPEQVSVFIENLYLIL